jgi:hypothetical protein
MDPGQRSRRWAGDRPAGSEIEHTLVTWAMQNALDRSWDQRAGQVCALLALGDQIVFAHADECGVNERIFRVIRVDVVELEKENQVLEIPERSGQVRRLTVRMSWPEAGEIGGSRRPAFRRSTELHDPGAHMRIAEVVSDGRISVGRSCRLCRRHGSDVRRRVAGRYGCHTAARECRSLASSRAGRAPELTGSRAKKPAATRSVPRCPCAASGSHGSRWEDQSSAPWQVDCTSHDR